MKKYFTSSSIIKLVKDLEDTREEYGGYSYVRTIRNILEGNENSEIANHFSNKEYYGAYEFLSLSRAEEIMDELVAEGKLKVILAKRGKLYCTKEYYKHHQQQK